MAPRVLTIPTGRNLPKITGQSRSAEPSIINDKTIADFTRVVEQTGILRGDRAPEPRQPEERRPMPELTRRRSADHGNNCWHIYCGTVHVGTIAERTGNPHGTDPWEWSSGIGVR
jgi:hypothetical protein